ncbi:MAG TPA: TraR/DksA C4-type zinc finger protein [bacterium]|nr:TraR/DksA C4-type zinc finger protein [bacterium]
MDKTKSKKTASETSTKSAAKKNAPKTAKKTAHSKFSPSRILEIKTKLEKERNGLLQGMGNKQPVDDSGAHGDLVDLSTNYSEHETRLGMAEHERNRLAELTTALQKIEEGTYGICSKCGQEIPEARLNAMPTAKLCLVCQSKQESHY